MNAARLLAVAAILASASLAWVLLGDSITRRATAAQVTLGQDVTRMFGPPIEQVAPTLVAAGAPADEPGRPAERSEILVSVAHEHRYRGLAWFSVFRVEFDGTYEVAFPPGDAADAPVRFRMDLPEGAAIDGLAVTVGGTPVRVPSARIDLPIPPSRAGPVAVRVRYVSSGQDRWAYVPRAGEGGLRNFRLVATLDFDEVDYPATGLSPTGRAGRRPDGRAGVQATWAYEQMIPARNHSIGILMPQRLQAGALAARISTFAPVSLFFFFVVLVTIQVLRGWRLHPMNYLLVAAGFFAFHVLLAYLVDHVPLQVSFWIAAAVSVLLVVSYLRLVLGIRSAVLVAGGAQLVYLVFFSYAFFWEGWTGLTIVVGAVVTLFVVMQLTGRIDWGKRFAAASGEAGGGDGVAGRALDSGPGIA